jgi:hypothetical protein
MAALARPTGATHVGPPAHHGFGLQASVDTLSERTKPFGSLAARILLLTHAESAPLDHAGGLNGSAQHFLGSFEGSGDGESVQADAGGGR